MFTSRYSKVRAATLAIFIINLLVGITLLVAALMIILSDINAFIFVGALAMVVAALALLFSVLYIRAFYRDYGLYLATKGVILPVDAVRLFLQGVQVPGIASKDNQRIVISLSKPNDIDGDVVVEAKEGTAVLSTGESVRNATWR